MCDIIVAAASEFTVAIRSMGWTRYEDSFLIAGGRGNSGKLDNIYRLERYTDLEFPTFQLALSLQVRCWE